MNLSKMICLLLDLSKAFNTDNSSTILKNYKYLTYMGKILSDLKSIWETENSIFKLMKKVNQEFLSLTCGVSRS